MKAMAEREAKETKPARASRDVKAEAPVRLQRKWVVGTSDDPLEHAADRAADAVVAGIKAPPYLLQRKASGTNAAGWPVPASVTRVTAETGVSLDRDVRLQMESRLGHDFSRVRIHTDERAARSALDVEALAYTVGPHIVFAPGQYQPHSPSGRHLLAHELAHVVQQDFSAPSPVLQRKSGQPDAGIQEFRLDSDEEEQRLEVIKLIGEYRETIFDAAKKHGIPAEAIAGVILWEALENPYHQTVFRRGPGKIRSNVAEEAENAGLIEKPDTDNENEAGNIRGERLGKGGWALQYAAAIMKMHANTYWSVAHVDISKDAAILATLFNTGESEKRATALKEKLESDPTATPQPNEMGKWVTSHMSEIKDLLYPKPLFEANPIDPRMLMPKMNAYAEPERAIMVKKEAGENVVYYAQEIRRGGDPAWLTNNPGLLEYDTAIKQGRCYEGLKVVIKPHRIAVYSSRERGLADLKQFLRAHQGERTLKLIVETIPLIKATTKQAAAAIAKGMGLPEGTLVKSLTDAQLEQLAEEIEKVQGASPGKSEKRTK